MTIATFVDTNVMKVHTQKDSLRSMQYLNVKTFKIKLKA